MNFKIGRIFSGEIYKGTKGYLATQKKYEILRTVLFFGISLSLFVAGWLATGDRLNLLTVVAVLGCLPASKSAVEMIMFLRFQGCSPKHCREIEAHSAGLDCLYDMVFTSYEKNYVLSHMTVKGNTVCGYTQEELFAEKDFYKHIDDILKADHLTDVNVKIFKDIRKYTQRLEQMKELDAEVKTTDAVVSVLKSVAL